MYVSMRHIFVKIYNHYERIRYPYVKMLHIYVPNRHFYSRISYVLNEIKVLFDKQHLF